MAKYGTSVWFKPYLHAAAKAYAALHKMTLGEVVNEALEEYLQKRDPVLLQKMKEAYPEEKEGQTSQS